ncbi:hypothetical protein D3C77_631090 [compost metagenome]
MGERQQLADMLGTLRESHRIRVSPQRALAQCQPIRQALAAGVQQAILNVHAVQPVGRQA